MKTTRIASLAAATLFAVSASLTGVAHADTNLTRAQVQAELSEAQRTGNLIDFETGQKLNELFPSAYPDKVQQARVAPADSKTATTATKKFYEMTVFDAIAQRNPNSPR
jgi:hypothetical protein